MKFKEIYSRILPLWKTIDFSDGRIIAENNGFSSKNLTDLWNSIENTVGHENRFDNLMVWTIYQVIHKHTRNLFTNGVYLLNPTTLSKVEIEEQFFNNLNQQGWEDELLYYERTVD